MEKEGAFREVPYMGVIWVVSEAVKRGFWNGNPDWCNLGQGQPEIGEMEGAPDRLRNVLIEPEDQAYGPINGTDEMREAVAKHYNRYYRRGKTSRKCLGRWQFLQRGFAALATSAPSNRRRARKRAYARRRTSQEPSKSGTGH